MTAERSSVGDFALRAVVRASAGDWSVLVVRDAGKVRTVVDDLAFELRLATESFVTVKTDLVRAEDLIATIDTSEAQYVIVGVGETAPRSVWKQLDLLRDQIARRRSVVFVLTRDAFVAMQKGAPSVSAMLGSAVYELEEGAGTLSQDEREGRLAALRTEYGLTDEQVVDRAARGDLDLDPHIAEWLVLLGQGDLIRNDQ